MAIRGVLDDELPEAYGREIFDEKRQAIYEHIYASFGNDGESVYDGAVVAAPSPVGTLPTTEEASPTRTSTRPTPSGSPG